MRGVRGARERHLPERVAAAELSEYLEEAVGRIEDGGDGETVQHGARLLSPRRPRRARAHVPHERRTGGESVGGAAEGRP